MSTHEQEVYPTSSLDENGIEFELQTERNYYKTKEDKKEHKEKAKGNEGTVAAEEEQVSPNLPVTHLNIILHSVFSNVEMYNNN